MPTDGIWYHKQALAVRPLDANVIELLNFALLSNIDLNPLTLGSSNPSQTPSHKLPLPEVWSQVMHDRQASLRGKREYAGGGEWGAESGDGAVGSRHLKVIEDVFGNWHGGAGPPGVAGGHEDDDDDEEEEEEDETDGDDEGRVGDASLADMSMDSI